MQIGDDFYDIDGILIEDLPFEEPLQWLEDPVLVESRYLWIRHT